MALCDHNAAQDVLRCDLCDTPVPPMYCDLCSIYLCKACVGEHLSDTSSEHKVVPFEKRETTPKCLKHSTKICELHCHQCNIPICAQCISSIEHRTHDVVDILKSFKSKKEVIKRDLHELEKTLYPKYQEFASHNILKKENLSQRCHELKVSIENQGKALHREVDLIVQFFQSTVNEFFSKNTTALEQQADEINCKINDLLKTISDMQKILDSDDFKFVSTYKSRNEGFRKLPNYHQLKISLPNFIPHDIQREHILQQFGSLSDPIDISGPVMSMIAMSSIKTKGNFIDDPLVIAKINLTDDEHTELRSVSCLSDHELWTCGEDEIIRLYNLQGELLKSVQTISGNAPWDITVTLNGHLVYSDHGNGSINIVETNEVKAMIKLHEWMPLNICCSFNGDFLVVMINGDYGQTRLLDSVVLRRNNAFSGIAKATLSIHPVPLSTSVRTETWIYV